MKFAVLPLFLSLAALSSAATEERKRAPEAWLPSGGSPNGEEGVVLTFFLRSDDTQIKAEFLDRSNPRSDNFGKWLSNEQVHSLTAPTAEAVDEVTRYLSSFGSVTSKTPNSDILTVRTTFAKAEEMLDAKYGTYSHKETGHKIHRSMSYEIPSEIREHVALVGPTTRFPKPSQAMKLKSSDDDESLKSYSNSPDNLRALYSVNDVLGGTASKNNQAVTAFLGQYYSESDLAKFWEKEFPAGADTPIKLMGDATTGRAGVESMLDIEYMPAMGALNPTEFWGFSGASPMDDADEPFLTWLSTVSNTTDDEVPLVFSTSYGEDETVEVPSDYADRINTEFMKCGLRGISLLFASGDSGAASDAGTCPGDKFMPMWPAGSPYVTAVGGTTGGSMPESAWSGSSGGFSDVFAAPDWQADVTASYAANTDDDMPDSSYFNATGRGFPDIAAQACACPCSSGIFGLLNDARLAAGKSSLGFLNQILYSNPDALNDVTEGVQGGCGRTSGFPAKKGWDAVTGLGSPNYEKLLDVVMALP
ncbi:hypothetical protein TrST_g14115 [Triparma strigata]|uniref:subtilisin n=1 Tax=Triparma strigata TaxID=1606541 RepID=A0A9W7E5W0_9STRA|nr:hypothetical protein TrST_g14115 [Triparma strigata]